MKKALFLVVPIIALAMLFLNISPTLAIPFPPNMDPALKTQNMELYLKAKRNQPELDAGVPLLVPPLGTYKAIVLLVDFSDNPGTTNPALYENLLFSRGTYPTGSMRDYYLETSYNKFELTGDIDGTIGIPPFWYRMPETYAVYVNGQKGEGDYPQNVQKLAEDAVEAADPYVDYSQYDNDGDGVVDSLIIVYAGPRPGDNNHIWPHQYVMKKTNIVLDGKKLGPYAMISEYEKDLLPENDSTIGTFCHEYGHLLGLPDLYDLSSLGSGIGSWGLMGSGSYNGAPSKGSRPAHLCAYSKMKLGWVDPVEVVHNQFGTIISCVETSPSVFKLWTNGMYGPELPEFFLIENRQKVGFDDALPGDGLLIYHISDNIRSQYYHPYCIVDIEQADGHFSLNYRDNTGDKGDPWPGESGKRAFDRNSTPSNCSFFYQDTRVAVKNISDSAPSMTADLYINDSDPPIGCDLTGNWKSLRPYFRGRRLIGTFEINNIGNENASTFNVGFYLSDDGIKLGTFLKRVTIQNGLGAGMNKTCNFGNFSLNSLSNKYIIAVIDPEDKVVEIDKANNRITRLIP
ncbi:MAG: family metalloprotease protein [Candidatus Poribacteria bacterium]|nr:family metalloprotease protein [Euryarchaeota archaeon]MDQ1317165.1 family metalloprotease protein [Candidatus Poribacteria bacterium]